MNSKWQADRHARLHVARTGPRANRPINAAICGALGVVLYEMLTRIPPAPFVATTLPRCSIPSSTRVPSPPAR